MQRLKRNQGCVPGYWAPDPHGRMDSERTAQKVRKLLEDQLRLNGHPVWLWQPVIGMSTGTVPCTCDKETTSTSDYKCLSCYGTRFAPGYLKFGHETVYFASAEWNGYAGPYPAAQAAFTLTNVAVDLTKKPNRLQLISGSTTGTIVTPDKAYANAAGDPWEVSLAAYKKQAGDTVGLEFSTNAGTSWTAISLTASTYMYTGAFTATGTGTLRFRVTLTRSSGTSRESPSFEVVRARHVRSADVNSILYQREPEWQPGQILILRTWEQEMVSRDAVQGRTINAMGDRSMTAPLDFFDTSLTIDTPSCALDDREAGPHPMFQFASGVRATQRYAIHGINLDTTLDDVLSHQSFSERRIQPGEVYAYLW